MSYRDRLDAMREAERVGAARVDDLTREWIQRWAREAFAGYPHDPRDFHVWSAALNYVDAAFKAHYRDRAMTRDERHARNLAVFHEFQRLQQVGLAEQRLQKDARREQWQRR